MKPGRRRIDVNLDELDKLLDGARQAPLSEADYDKLKGVLHALAAMIVRPHTSEKTRAVIEEMAAAETIRETASDSEPPRTGHGRNRAQAFAGAQKIAVAHPELSPGDRCPECGNGNVYGQKEPKVLVRIVGQVPLAATVYSLERLRCGACGQVFTAQEPEEVGPEKYDETASAMIAQLKYGSVTPFYRLEQLEAQLGIPLPAATQWEIVEETAELIKPARDELIRQAAQGKVLHNDDTSMRVLKLKRPEGDPRTGVFTSGIVSTNEGRSIALFFTGAQHAGENMAEVLKRRAAELPAPIQMCDALSRNLPKLPGAAEILLANCLAHGRRQFVEVAANFPTECRYVLEMLGQVYGNDAEAREQRLTPEWYLFAILYMPAITLAAAVTHRLITGSWPRFGHEGPIVIAIAIIISTPGQSGEEIGWRGYALPRLAARFGLAPAGVLLGVIWGVWHVPLFFLTGADKYGQSLPVYLMGVIALSVAIAWLYARSHGSLLLTMLMHSAFNQTIGIVSDTLLPGEKPFALGASLAFLLTAALPLRPQASGYRRRLNQLRRGPKCVRWRAIVRIQLLLVEQVLLHSA